MTIVIRTFEQKTHGCARRLPLGFDEHSYLPFSVSELPDLTHLVLTEKIVHSSVQSISIVLYKVIFWPKKLTDKCSS